MVDYQIHHYLDAPFMCRGKHLVKIFHSTELGHDILIITDIIAVVVIWRLVYGRQPYHIYTKLLQIVKLTCNTVQITYSVSVAVTKASRINLINYSFLPPCLLHFLTSLYYLHLSYTPFIILSFYGRYIFPSITQCKFYVNY